MNGRESGPNWTIMGPLVVMVVLYVHFHEALTQRDRAVDRAETIATKAQEATAGLVAQMATWSSQGFGQRTALAGTVVYVGIVLTLLFGAATFIIPHLPK